MSESTSAALDLDAIEAAAKDAKNAAGGPWAWESVGEKDNSWCVGTTDPPHAGQIVEQYDEETRAYLPKPEVVDWICQSGGDLGFDIPIFIAAASPDVVLALVARLRAAEARLSNLRAALAQIDMDHIGKPAGRAAATALVADTEASRGAP